jgi:hypothetical protein
LGFINTTDCSEADQLEVSSAISQMKIECPHDMIITNDKDITKSSTSDVSLNSVSTKDDMSRDLNMTNP